MKAEIGKRYALIQNGRCHWKFDITTLPEWHDGLQVVDITGVNPEPEEGDLVDGVNFSKPLPPSSALPSRDIVDAILSLPANRLNLLKAELRKP